MKHLVLPGAGGASVLLAAFVMSVVGTTLGAPLAAIEKPWYVEAKLGQAQTEAEFGRVHRKFFDDESDAASVELGYTLNRYLAIQGGYHDAGEVRGFGSPCPDGDQPCIESLATPLQATSLCVEGAICPLIGVELGAESESWSLAAVPRWPVNDRFALRAKIGVSAWETTVSGLLAEQSSERFSGTDALFGIGAEWSWPSGLGALVEHTDSDPGLAATQVGMSWRF